MKHSPSWKRSFNKINSRQKGVALASTVNINKVHHNKTRKKNRKKKKRKNNKKADWIIFFTGFSKRTTELWTMCTSDIIPGNVSKLNVLEHSCFGILPVYPFLQSWESLLVTCLAVRQWQRRWRSLVNLCLLVCWMEVTELYIYYHSLWWNDWRH